MEASLKKALTISTVLALLLGATSELAAQDAAPKRDPGVAAALSFVVPGAGSFYAGHAGHGLRHSVIAATSLTGVLAGINNCKIGLLGSPSEYEELCGVGAVSAVIFLVNWAWAVNTAWKDAKEFNRRHRLEVEPRLVAFRTRSGPAVGLELVRIGL